MSMSPSSLPPEFAPHFEGLGEGRISFPVCKACGAVNWYPMKLCRSCRSADFAWKAVSGPARLWSWTVVRRPFLPQWQDKLPYIVGLVEFEDVPGTRLVSNIIGCEPEELSVHAALEPVFTVSSDGTPAVHFRIMMAGAQ